MEFGQVHESLRRQLAELLEEASHAQMARDAAEARLRDLARQIAELEQEETILRRVAARYDIEPPRDGLLPREVAEWQALSRTDAVLRVLEEAERPLSPAEIAKALAERGRDDSGHLVSAALAYLKDNRVIRLGQGKWAAPFIEQGEPSVQLDGVALPDYMKSRPAEIEPASQRDAT